MICLLLPICQNIEDLPVFVSPGTVRAQGDTIVIESARIWATSKDLMICRKERGKGITRIKHEVHQIVLYILALWAKDLSN